MSKEIVMSLADGIVELASGMTIRSAEADCARIGSDIAEIYRLAGPTREQVVSGRDLYTSARALSAYLRQPTYLIARRLPDYSLRRTVIERAHAFRDHCPGMLLLSDFSVR